MRLVTDQLVPLPFPDVQLSVLLWEQTVQRFHTCSARGPDSYAGGLQSFVGLLGLLCGIEEGDEWPLQLQHVYSIAKFNV